MLIGAKSKKSPLHQLLYQVSNKCKRRNHGRHTYRFLLLKIDKQISGTIYRPFLAANEA